MKKLLGFIVINVLSITSVLAYTTEDDAEFFKERDSEAYTPKGLRAGSFKFLPSMAVTNEYNTNIYMRDKAYKTPDSFIAHYKPGVSVSSDWTRHVLNFYINTDVTQFATLPDQNNYHDVLTKIDGRLDLTRDSFFTGGGRNTDGLPVSENSIEMLNFTQRFGTMGVEIDIHVSADGVPFLYHDDDINIRLCQKGPIQGPIDNYTWEELSAYVRLVHGEQIPSLENALNFILDSTDMKFVWLDLKVSNNAAAKVIPIQMAILARAKQMGRDLQIVYGCPSEEVITDFMSYPGYQDIPSLCELSIDDVHKINAHAWGPRWTEGEQQAGLQEIHNQGRIGITWTLDDMSYIQKYIAEADFDGFLTNYPCLVAYYHYIR